ncbi:alpha/beta hydrolase [Natrinema versiforme]|uniref:Alpha/beta hydrolase fold-3 protein domain-containing protein n=1 Tax=Natrinema versiforme JCM 10478 TaxID=1227496 RepID=L9Y5F4_9EURY|nr:alpha/beta hydrolase [Natrinema versiforme]ELY68103.1 alpha/beta hydrolase fold-3 protein domain-containing protein [Natrinema versiforme JCM 10478]
MTSKRAAEPHPDVQAFLELYDSLDAPAFSESTPEEARRNLEEMRATDDPDIELASVEDHTIDGPHGDLAIRRYDPGTEGADRPVILYVHGGGWVIGSVDTHDGVCRKLAAESGYPVVSVDYGLAPEHPFPEGLEDCYAALEWVAESADERRASPDEIVVAGDSAGGSLAAGLSLLVRDRGGPDIAYQLLIYPSAGDATVTEAYERNKEGYFLTADDMAWFRSHYFESEIDMGNVYAFPLLADDLSGLPPATVITAGFDPLRDVGADYADRLADAGVPVEYHNYDDMIHGFFSMISDPVNLDRAHEAHDAAVSDLHAALE